MSDLSKFLERAEALLARLEVLLPALQPPVDWNAASLSAGASAGGTAICSRSCHPHDQARRPARRRPPERLIEQNTRQFVRRQPANNVLLTGARGTGKSSLVKALPEQVPRERACA